MDELAGSLPDSDLSEHSMDEEIKRLAELLQEKTSIGGYSNVDEEIRRIKMELEDTMIETKIANEDEATEEDNILTLLKIAQEKSKRKEEELRVQIIVKQEEAVKRIGYQLQNNNESYVCFLIDLTASMNNLLPYVKKFIRGICQYLRDSKIHCKFGLVGYRDEEHARNRVYHNFSEEDSMIRFLETRVKAYTEILNSRGKTPDLPEDLLGGFATVRQLAWPKQKHSLGVGKAVIHFADAPCHGSKYHMLHDNKPEGEFATSLEQEMIHLAKSNINYSLFSASHANDQMIAIMKEAFGVVRNESVDFHVTEVMLALSLII